MDLLRERRARLAALLGGLVFIACLILEAMLADPDLESRDRPAAAETVTHTSP